MQKFQLKGERFGGGGGHFGRGWRRGFRGGLSRQGDTCYKCGGTGHWAIDCKGRGNTESLTHTICFFLINDNNYNRSHLHKS